MLTFTFIKRKSEDSGAISTNGCFVTGAVDHPSHCAVRPDVKQQPFSREETAHV